MAERDRKSRERKAKFRLKDIIVEEISIVDRPANKKRFLLIKHAGGSAMEQQVQDTVEQKSAGEQAEGSTAHEDQEKRMHMKMPAPVRQRVLEALRAAVESATSALEAVSSAEPAEGEVEEPVPKDVLRWVKQAVDALGAVLERYPYPAPKQAQEHQEKAEGAEAESDTTRQEAQEVAQKQEVEAAVLVSMDQFKDLLDKITDLAKVVDGVQQQQQKTVEAIESLKKSMDKQIEKAVAKHTDGVAEVPVPASQSVEAGEKEEESDLLPFDFNS